MQQHEQIEFLKAVGAFVTEQVNAATMPLRELVSDLQDKIKDLGKQNSLLLATVQKTISEIEIPAGKDGKDGIDGKDAKEINVDEVKLYVLNQVMQQFHDFPIKDGKDGTSVQLEDVLPAITPVIDQTLSQNMKYMKERVEEFLSGIPKPKDGADGKDGKDGRDGMDGQSVSLDDLRISIIDMVRSAVDDLPVPRHVVSGHVDRAGCLHHVFNNGETLALGVVVGRDGKDGKDGENGKDGKDGKDGENGKDGMNGAAGQDGLGFKDMSVTFDGERDLIFKFVLDERTEELALTIPFQIYRGVWREGSYKRGDTVSRDGSQWVAIRDTDAQPGTAESGWQLSVKKGRDGRDGKSEKGDKGDKGDPGRDGRDLTQLGQDGLKWG